MNFNEASYDQINLQESERNKLSSQHSQQEAEGQQKKVFKLFDPKYKKSYQGANELAISFILEELRQLISNQLSEQNQKHYIIMFVVVLFSIIINLVNCVNRIDYQTLDIDYKLKNLVSNFEKQLYANFKTNNKVYGKEINESKEFSFYQDQCFTYAMRKGMGQFIQIPSNTLVQGDIILLQPGDIAPALVQLYPYDFIEIKEEEDSVGKDNFEQPKVNLSNQKGVYESQQNQYRLKSPTQIKREKGGSSLLESLQKKQVKVRYQEVKNEYFGEKIYLNKGSQFIISESNKPEYLRMVNQQEQLDAPADKNEEVFNNLVKIENVESPSGYHLNEIKQTKQSFNLRNSGKKISSKKLKNSIIQKSMVPQNLLNQQAILKDNAQATVNSNSRKKQIPNMKIKKSNLNQNSDEIHISNVKSKTLKVAQQSIEFDLIDQTAQKSNQKYFKIQSSAVQNQSQITKKIDFQNNQKVSKIEKKLNYDDIILKKRKSKDDNEILNIDNFINHRRQKKSFFEKDENENNSKQKLENLESEYYDFTKESLLEKFNRQELNKEFRKKMKKQYLFEVKRTPCIQDLNDYILFHTDLLKRDLSSKADELKDKIIYYRNRQIVIEFMQNVIFYCWIICFFNDIAYYIAARVIQSQDINQITRWRMSDSHFILATCKFIIPTILHVIEAWTNGIFETLFEQLQVQDYNKNFHSFFSDKSSKKGKLNHFYSLNNSNYIKESSNNERRFKDTFFDKLKSYLSCGCFKKNDENEIEFSGYQKKELEQKQRKNGKQSQKSNNIGNAIESSSGNNKVSGSGVSSKDSQQQLRKGDRKNSHQYKFQYLGDHPQPNKFYEEKDFKNREINLENLKRFWSKFITGINPNENKVAQMSSVSIFAFIDKEGIVTESQKFIDEVAVLNKRGEKQIINLFHNTLIYKENKIYQFEEKQKYFQNQQTLKAIGLAFMLAKNPNDEDTSENLQEMFIMDKIPTSSAFNYQNNGIEYIDNSKVLEILQKESGYQFHNVLKQETESHQDCLCSLAMHIGHTDKSFQQYKKIKQLWNIQRNQDVRKNKESTLRDAIINKDVEPIKQYKEYHSASESLHSKNELGYQLSLEEIGSQETENIQNNPLIFVDFKVIQMVEKKRQAGFCHILTSIVQDKESKKCQSFTRGEASVVFNECTDYWDGEKIEHISDQIRSDFKNLLAQWNDQYYTIGFSYKPITENFYKSVLEHLLKKKKNKKGMSFSENLMQEKSQRDDLLPQDFNDKIEKVEINNYEDLKDNLQNKKRSCSSSADKLIKNSSAQFKNGSKNSDSYNQSKNIRQSIIQESFKEKLRESQRDQIFLGFVAIKQHAKKEVNQLISSLSLAGIRGVLYSKEDILRSKALAQDLGIDTGWNSWISLDDDPEEQILMQKNWDGNTILPQGVDGVIEHIEKVDEVPLQVQIFCKTNHERTKRMFEIYQKNTEVVACIGNILNSTNLRCFMQANVSIGMMIEPSYRCKRCNGRITIEQLVDQQEIKGQKVNKQKLIKQMKEPSIVERFSSALTALACTFVLAANANIYQIFPALREARRLKMGMETTILMTFVSYGTLLLSYMISEVLLGINSHENPLLSQYQLYALLFLIFPVSCLSCLAIPWNLQLLMNRLVLNRRFRDILPYQIKIVKFSLTQCMLAAISINIVRLVNLTLGFINDITDQEQWRFAGNMIFYDILWNKYQLRESNLYSMYVQNQIQRVKESQNEREIHSNFVIVMLIITSIQIGKEFPLNKLFQGYSTHFIKVGQIIQRFFHQIKVSCLKNKSKNKESSQNINQDYFNQEKTDESSKSTNFIFQRFMILQLFIAFTYYLVLFVVVGTQKDENDQSQNQNISKIKISNFQTLNWPSWTVCILCILGLLFYEHLRKKAISQQFEKDGQIMKIFFSTRLGMYSPR